MNDAEREAAYRAAPDILHFDTIEAAAEYERSRPQWVQDLMEGAMRAQEELAPWELDLLEHEMMRKRRSR